MILHENFPLLKIGPFSGKDEMSPLRIATRSSALAKIQANQVRGNLLKNFPELKIELVFISTRGDEILDRPLAEVGGKALFIKALEEALIRGEADIAVHSLKDVPSLLEDAFSLLAYLNREDPRDVFLSRQGFKLSETPAGTRIGTSSPRRAAQIRYFYPNLLTESLRGNVPTRLAKVEVGAVDGAILAQAGLNRLDLGQHSLIREVLPLGSMLPAPGQGIIAVECLKERAAEFSNLRRALNHAFTESAALAERGFSASLSGDCFSPICALAQVKGEALELWGRVLDREGSRLVEETLVFTMKDSPELMGQLLAERLLSRGAKDLL